MDTEGTIQFGIILIFIGVMILCCFAATFIHALLTFKMFCLLAFVFAVFCVGIGGLLVYRAKG